MSTTTIQHHPIVFETTFNLDNAPASVRTSLAAMSTEELQNFVTVASIAMFSDFLEKANEGNSYAVLRIKE